MTEEEKPILNGLHSESTLNPKEENYDDKNKPQEIQSTKTENPPENDVQAEELVQETDGDEKYEAAGPSKLLKSRWDDSPSTSRDDTNDGRPRSPGEKCPICLGPMANKSVTDGCVHGFCYVCILEWSKVKAECPLCKTKFQKIRHDFEGDEKYEEYDVPAPPEAPRFRYRRATTGERYELLSEIRRLQTQIMLAQTRNLTGRRQADENRNDESEDPSSRLFHSRRRRDYTRNVLNSGPRETMEHFENYRDYVGMARNLHRYRQLYQASRQEPRERLIGAPDFRRLIYERGLRVQPAEDDERRSGFLRLRDITPQFFADNPAQITRLVPWIDRELRVLLQNDIQRVHIVTQQICQLISRYEIRSTMMHMRVGTVLFQNTEHFLYELYHFARSPCQTLEEYDRQSHYQQGVQNGQALSASGQDVETGPSTSSATQQSTTSTTDNQSTSPSEPSTSNSDNPRRPSRRSQEDIQVVEEHPAPMNPALLYPDIRVPFYERDHPEPIRDPNLASTAQFPPVYQQIFDLDPTGLNSGRFHLLASSYDGHIMGNNIYPAGLRERRKKLQEKIDQMKRRKRNEQVKNGERMRTRSATAANAEATVENEVPSVFPLPAPIAAEGLTPLVDLTEEDDFNSLEIWTPPPMAAGESTDSADSPRSPPIQVRSNTPEIIKHLRSIADFRREARIARKRQADFARLADPNYQNDDENDSLSDPDQPGPSWRSTKISKSKKEPRKSKNPVKSPKITRQSEHIRFVSSDSSDSNQKEGNSETERRKDKMKSQLTLQQSQSNNDNPQINLPENSREDDSLTDDQVNFMARHLGLTNDSAPGSSRTSASFNVSSDSDNDDLEVLCEMPPKHLRTPPIVTLDDADEEEVGETSTVPVAIPITDTVPRGLDTKEEKLREKRHKSKKHKKHHKKERRRRDDPDYERRRKERKKLERRSEERKFSSTRNGYSSRERSSTSSQSPPRRLRSFIGDVKRFPNNFGYGIDAKYRSLSKQRSPEFVDSKRSTKSHSNHRNGVLGEPSSKSKRRSRSNPV